MLESLFKLSENKTTLKTEIIAGFTTFLTMGYIIFVNPDILSQAGIDRDAAFVATCVASALATLAMGLYANYPIALAPGMGVNAFFTYSVVLGAGHSWQVALGAVFLAGVLFLILTVLPIREWVINAIPPSQKIAIAAGIGLFLAIIALQNMATVIDHPVTLVTLGDIAEPTVLLAIFCFLIIVTLEARKIPGAIIIGIFVTTLLGMLFGITEIKGVFSMPPSLSPTLGQLDIAGAFDIAMLGIVLAFLFVHMFDTAGTLVSVANSANLLDKDGKLPRLNKVLLADSTTMAAGAVIGTSPTTSYIESTAGVNAGGRTGLTAVVVALLFLASLFLSPLVGSIPSYATFPVLLFVATYMVKNVTLLDWEDMTEYVPAVVTIIVMPLSFSITDGIGFGIISYAILKITTGQFNRSHIPALIMALVFVSKYVFLGTE
ncbi:NCS2 family permease [Aliikangiella marina]|uniref:NCS2 family permease n=1 Tax=Aliikangiella marina TaxID=1712262 RepID=A0A545THN3_9GAMM|nr:NCS2 family permease [Aliikangiella marina]TQV76740.1 NCS2 family permease [Aliikangiella marina]